MVAVAKEPSVSKRSTRLADMVQMANGLNAARALAAILVVLLHSAIPYMVTQVPVLWVVHDTSQHILIDALVVGINGFVMPLFFLLAGMSIAKSSLQKPFREFAWQRFRRLGATFALATILIVPLILICWGLGLLWTERLTMGHFARMRFPSELQGYVGPMHLWFLEYLLLLSIGWAAIARIAKRWSFAANLVQGKWSHGVLGSVWGPLIFAVPTMFIFACDLDTPFRLVTPFTPDVTRTLHYLVFLVAGVWLSSLPDALSKLRANAPFHLLIGTLAFMGACPLTLDYFKNDINIQEQWVLIALHSIFAWSMVFGFLGAMMRWFSDRRESIRYANEASFWLYLGHFPLVCAMQLVVLPWQINPVAKLLIVATTGVLVTLASYQFGVRYSWLGAVLNGRRKDHASARGWRLEAGWVSLATIGAMLFAVFLYTGWKSVLGSTLSAVGADQVYRSNRLQRDELEDCITSHNIRSVISLAPGNRDHEWFRTQQEVCSQREISLTTLAIDESQVPSSKDLERLQLALKNSPRPLLLVGGNRSPTLSGFGSAVAILANEGSPKTALSQFDMRFFQLEGAEHCIVAQPLRQYRDWLQTHELPHSAERFHRWNLLERATPEELISARERQPVWQAMMGYPRYPRQY